MNPTGPTPNLSGDLASAIPRAGVSMFMVVVRAAHWQRETRDGVAAETGPLTFQVSQVIHGAAPDTPTIEIPATRFVEPLMRVKNKQNQWNSLPLEPGATLILAARPAGFLWTAVAADQFTDANLSAVRRAYDIEDFRGPVEQRYKMIEQALESEWVLLRNYAVDAILRDAPAQRARGVEALRQAILAPEVKPQEKLELGFNLSDLALLVPGQADETNQTIVATLATALVNEKDPERRNTWSTFLASAVMRRHSEDAAEDTRIRSALVHAPQNPPAARVVEVLSEIAARIKGDERRTLKQLIRAWRSQ